MSTTPADALDAIHELLDGREWDADTCQSIADVLIAHGYEINEPEDAP